MRHETSRFPAAGCVALEASITADATETIDARGKVVTAGLIDIHTHAGRSKEGPPMCLQDGVTGWVDAGSGGADNIDAVAAIARGAPQTGRCLVNIARTGVVTPTGELHDINAANVAMAKAAVERNRDVVVGVKARLSDNVAGANDLEALRRAQEVATTFNLPVMIHIGQNYRRCALFWHCSSVAISSRISTRRVRTGSWMTTAFCALRSWPRTAAA